MKVTHGRKGQPEEYLEIKLDRPKIAVVAQKSGENWFLYLVEPGKNGVVRSVRRFDTSEDARCALDIAAETLTSYAR